MADLLQVLGNVEQKRRQDLYNMAQPQINLLKQQIQMEEQKQLQQQELLLKKQAEKDKKISQIKQMGAVYDPSIDIDEQIFKAKEQEKQKYAIQQAEVTTGRTITHTEDGSVYAQIGKEIKEEEQLKQQQALEQTERKYTEQLLRELKSRYTAEDLKELGVNEELNVNNVYTISAKVASANRTNATEKLNASLLSQNRISAKEKKERVNGIAQTNEIFNTITQGLNSYLSKNKKALGYKTLKKIYNKDENIKSIEQIIEKSNQFERLSSADIEKLIDIYTKMNDIDKDASSNKKVIEDIRGHFEIYNLNANDLREQKRLETKILKYRTKENSKDFDTVYKIMAESGKYSLEDILKVMEGKYDKEKTN